MFEKHPLLTSCGRARLHHTIHIQDLFSTCWHETKKRPQIKSNLVDDVQRKSPQKKFLTPENKIWALPASDKGEEASLKILSTWTKKERKKEIDNQCNGNVLK